MGLYLIHAAGCQHIASAKKNRNKKVRKKVLAIIEEKHEKKNVCQLQTKKVTAVAT